MTPETLVRILNQYGYENCAFGKPASGYRNLSWPVHVDGKVLNLILYKNEPEISKTIQLTHKMGNALSDAGLPVRRPIDRRILQIKTASGVRYCGLYNYLPGVTIPWEAYTMNHLKLLGKGMSDMHAALRKTAVDAPSVVAIYQDAVMRMEGYYAQNGVQRAMYEKLGFHDFSQVFTTFHNLLKASENLPNQQLLHMDFVRGNVLFDGNADDLHISGILDLEKAAYGHPLFDIARTLAFLIVDCKYKEEEKTRKYFLKSGYQKRGQQKIQIVNINGKSVLESLVDLFLIYDLYKFMRHNPYESLKENEHFVRTVNLLVKRQLITPVV